MIPKNGTGKKEKPKSELKANTERKNSQLSVRPARDLLNVESEKTSILSPRSLHIDFNGHNDTNNLLNSARKIQTFCSISRSNMENVMKNDKVLTERLNSYLALTRYPSKHIVMKDNPLSWRKSVNKVPDSSRRHASCGPKLISIAAPNEKKIDVDDVVGNDQSKIKCVGNRYGPDIEVNDTLGGSKRCSSRKRSQETSRAVNIRGKLKPMNTLSKSPRTIIPNSIAKPMANSNEYRNYMSQISLQANKLPSKLSIHSNYYNSNLYAIGMSLRAWQSKHNHTKSNAISPNQANKSILKGKNL